MPSTTKSAVRDLARCPNCDAAWAYTAADGRHYSHLIGRIWNDRVQEWADCPMRWPVQ